MVRRIRLDAAKTIQEGEDQFLMRKQAESQPIKLSLAVEQSSCSVIIADTKGCIEYVNPKVTQITGYTKEELIGKHPHIFKSNKTPREQYAHLWNTIKSGSEWRREFLNKKKIGGTLLGGDREIIEGIWR